MNDLCADIGYKSINHYGEELCGDHVDVVEQDEKESHLRKILNYGHTIGHGFESAANGKYLHGECVALGMLFMSGETVQKQLLDIYKKIGFAVPKLTEFDMEAVKGAILHDKKANDQSCSVVFVDEIGRGQIEEWPMQQVMDRLEGGTVEECIWK